MSYWLWPHGLQHPRLPCPLPTPRACSNSCSSSWWCHQSFPDMGSFLISHFFPSGGQSIGVSASASVLPMNIQNWFPLRLTGFVSWQYKGLSRVFSNTTVQRHQFFTVQLSLWSNSHIHTTIGKTIPLTRQTYVIKVVSLLLNMLSSWSQLFFQKASVF